MMKRHHKLRISIKILLFSLLFILLLCSQIYASPVNIWDGTSSDGFESGTGTETDPYIIMTAEQLKYFADTVNTGTSYSGLYVSLGADIYLNDTTNWENWESIVPNNSWTAIGKSYEISFRGTFDGQGHIVNGMYINTNENYQGLFGYVSNGTIKNLGVADSYIKDSSVVGGVVGYNVYGTVNKCYNMGRFKGDQCNDIGGVVGQNYDGTINDCYNTGSVTCTGDSSCVGGVVGYNMSGTITNCYNTSAVTGNSDSDRVGGVVGLNYGTVNDCYNMGCVTGFEAETYLPNIGGVVGENGEIGTVINCYNTGSVTGVNNLLGGVVGGNCGTTKECYNNGSIIGAGNSDVGGVIGYNRGTTRDCYNNGDVTGTGSGSVGGVVGGNTYDGILNECYNTGNVTDTGSSKGGVLGINWETTTITNCYYLDTSVTGGNSYGTTLTHEQMQLQESFVDWDFENVWTMEGDPDYLYPELQRIPHKLDERYPLYETEEDYDKVAFEIKRSDITVELDGDLSEYDELCEIDLKQSWMSYHTMTADQMAEAKSISTPLYMTYDDTYLYIATSYTPSVFSNEKDDDVDYIWQEASIQVNVSSTDAVDEDRLEYGIALSSVTGNMLSTVWANRDGYDYQPEDNYFVKNENGTLIYETRVAWIDFLESVPETGDKFGFCIVWSFGEGTDYAHKQLASGCSGHSVKKAQNFAVISLDTPPDERYQLYETEEDYDKVAFEIKKSDITVELDGDLSEYDETYEIPLQQSWMSYVTMREDQMAEAKTLTTPLYMTYDNTYLYIATYYTPSVFSNEQDNDIGGIWKEASIQICVSSADAVDEDRLEYGIALSSVTSNMLSTVWANRDGYDYDPEGNYFVKNDNGTLIYETRIAWTDFLESVPETGDKFGFCIVWSFGEGEDHAHKQLASGCTGESEKKAQNFAVLSLDTPPDDIYYFYEIEEDYDKVAFEIKKSDITVELDGNLSEYDETYEIPLQQSWMSYYTMRADQLAEAKAINTPLYMTYDDTYLYIATYYTPSVFSNEQDDDVGGIWKEASIQVNVSSTDAVDEDRLEYGIALSSLTGNMLSTVWANRDGYDYDPEGNYFVKNDNGTLIYETRIAWTDFLESVPETGDKFGFCIVWSFGEGEHHAHKQLASGCSGYSGKKAQNFAVISLDTPPDERYSRYEAEEDYDKVAFEIKKSDINVKLDGDLSEYDETYEIPLQQSWMSYTTMRNSQMVEAKTINTPLYMTYDNTYLYIATYYTPSIFSNEKDDDVGNIWQEASIQVCVSSADAVELDRLEYGIALSSVTGNMLSTVWANRDGYDYDPEGNYFVKNDNGTLIYETRIAWTDFLKTVPQRDDKFGFCIVWSFGEGEDHAHKQLASGCTGDLGKKAQNFAIVMTNDWEYTINSDNTTASLIKYNGKGTIIAIPSKIDEYSITTINSNAFDFCEDLISITIPDSITHINTNAFVNCENLLSVIFNGSEPEYFDTDVFNNTAEGFTIYYFNTVSGWTTPTWNGYRCSPLTSDGFSYEINDTEATILKYVGNESTVSIPEEINVPDTSVLRRFSLNSNTNSYAVTSIGDNAFKNNPIIKSVTIPSTITTIGTAVFQNCSSLNEVYIQGNAPTIGDSVFEGVAEDLKVVRDEGTTGWDDGIWDDIPTIEQGWQIVDDYVCYYIVNERFIKGTKTINEIDYNFDDEGRLIANNLFITVDNKIHLVVDSKIAKFYKSGKSKVSSLLSSFDSKYTLQVVKSDNVQIDNSESICTGYKLQLINLDDDVIYEILIVVEGDVNGDGSINIRDIREIQKHILKEIVIGIDTAYYQAANLYLDGTINIRDIREIQKIILP